MKNRRASIFAVALVLITFVSLSYALGSFILVKKSIEISESPNSELIDMYNQEIKDIFYTKELLKLKAQEELYRISVEGAVSGEECVIRSEEYIEWRENCKPNTEELKKRFTTEAESKETKKIIEGGYVNYEIEYEYDNSASIKLEDLGIYPEEFETIYEQANSCKKKEDIEGCMSLKNWNLIVKKVQEYELFDVSTKKNFFFGGKFEPILLKFSIKK